MYPSPASSFRSDRQAVSDSPAHGLSPSPNPRCSPDCGLHDRLPFPDCSFRSDRQAASGFPAHGLSPSPSLQMRSGCGQSERIWKLGHCSMLLCTLYLLCLTDTIYFFRFLTYFLRFTRTAQSLFSDVPLSFFPAGRYRTARSPAYPPPLSVFFPPRLRSLTRTAAR